FDGTIADTLLAIVRITNRLAPHYGFTPTTPERLAYYRTLTPQQLLAQSEIPLFRIPFLIRRVRRELHREIDQLLPIADLPEVLQQLSQEHSLMIVSSNSAGNIRQFLALNQLADLFGSIHANVGLLGKARRLRRILGRQQIDDALYIGDETRDVAAAREIGLPVVAVGWGFSSIEALAAQDPDFLAVEPQQLLAIVSHLTKAPLPPAHRVSAPTIRASETPDQCHKVSNTKDSSMEGLLPRQT
ncbi:MAG: HAD hydrolase-like protein, partial [Cyanobacteria bacterium J06632_22]